MTPLAGMGPEAILEENPWGVHVSQPETELDVDVDIQFFEKYIRFGLHFNKPLSNMPALIVGLHSWEKRFLPLIPKDSRNFIGTLPWEDGLEGLMTTEVRFSDFYGLEKVVQESMQVFAITPGAGGSVISPDGHCSVKFLRDAVYQPILTYCQQDTFSNPMGSKGQIYGIFPQDVLLRRSAQVMIDVKDYMDDKEKLGIYTVRDNGRVNFVGNNWENGMISAWTGSLNRFTVLVDTVIPEIHYVYPGPDVYIRNRTPRIVVGFEDTLSGISGENDYTVYLNNIRLIVELDPIHKMAFHRIEEPLEVGKHFINIIIHDRAGNTAMRRSAFYVDP